MGLLRFRSRIDFLLLLENKEDGGAPVVVEVGAELPAECSPVDKAESLDGTVDIISGQTYVCPAGSFICGLSSSECYQWLEYETVLALRWWRYKTSKSRFGMGFRDKNDLVLNHNLFKMLNKINLLSFEANRCIVCVNAVFSTLTVYRTFEATIILP